MKLVTSSQMRALDQAAIQRHGIPSLTLMERAGKGVADAVRRRFSPDAGTVAVVAGRGNNGGDGLVAARHLIAAGHDVVVVLLASPTELSPDARANWELLVPMTPRIFQATAVADLSAVAPRLAQAAVIVDAIFGTGLEREISGLALQAIRAIDAAGAPVIAVDVPSGLSADTGEVKGAAVRAVATVTFGLPKRGLLIAGGPEHAGAVEVIDIGIPQEEVDRIDVALELIEPGMFAAVFAPRDPAAHKGDFGHVAVFAGSRGHLGAGYLACLAALRAGAGLVTYGIPEKAFARFDARYPEIMCDPIPDAGGACFHPDGLEEALRIASSKDAVVIGPAIGTEKATREFVNAFVRRLKRPLVIDADALNVLDPAAVRDRAAPTVLTPHPGEMGRLCGTSATAVQADRIGAASRFADECKAIVVLKGRGTVVAAPGCAAAINPTGNAGMATAGMGDALTGVVAALLAQGAELRTACCAAVYLHGLAGDVAAAECGERALITSDVIRKLGEAMHIIETRDARRETRD